MSFPILAVTLLSVYALMSFDTYQFQLLSLLSLIPPGEHNYFLQIDVLAACCKNFHKLTLIA